MAEPCILYPIRFTTASPTIEIDVDTQARETVTLSVVADRDYWLSGDGNTVAGEEDLIKILEDALETNGFGQLFTLTLTDDNHLKVDSGGSFSFYWTSSNTTVDGTIFGFPGGDIQQSDDTILTYTTPNATKGFWRPGTDKARAYEEDSRDEPVSVGHFQRATGGGERGWAVKTGVLPERFASYSLLEEGKILHEFAYDDMPFGAFQYAWDDGGIAKGRPVRLYDDKTDRALTAYQVYRIKDSALPWVELGASRRRLYRLSLPLLRVSAVYSNPSSLLFNGTNQRMDVPDDPSIELSTQFTLSGWIKLDSGETYTNGKSVVGRWETNQRSWFWGTLSTGKLRFHYADSLSDAGVNSVEISATNTLTPGVWHHIVAVYNAGTVTVYVDGNSVALTTNGTIPSALQTGGTSPIVFANMSTVAVQHWPGNLDEFSMWSTALSADEVGGLSLDRKPADLTGKTGLVSWWRFGDGVGDNLPTIRDQVGGNDGAGVNSPTLSTDVP